MKRLLRTTIRVWALAVAAVSLSMVMVQPAVGAPTVKGDAAAWAEIVAALKKGQTVSFRRKSTLGMLEFAPPDSIHSITQLTKRIEVIRVGNKSWQGVDGKWDCSNAKHFEEVQLWNQNGEVTVTRIPGLVIGGMPTHGYAWTYTFNVAGQTITGNEKLYVGVQNGLPLRDVVQGSGSPITFDYYDYGAKITITPPCS